MSFIEAARKRRSIRKYKPDPVPEDVIMELLEAARLAPSGCNAQPWKYVIIKDRKVIRQLRTNKIFWQDFIYNVPLLIIGCGNLSEYDKNREGIESQMQEAIQPVNSYRSIKELFRGQELVRTTRDIRGSMDNIMYGAEELGLGTCFVGCFYRDRLKDFLQLPKNLEPILSLTIGYPAESPEQRPRKPLSEIIYRII